MKNIILISICLMLNSGIFANTQIDDVFEDAVTSFELKDYSKALDRFKSIENEGIISADLFYNIGNCYFRLNEVGRSILYFKKALKVKSNHEAAQRNLKYALTFTQDKQGSGSEDVIKSFWEKAFES
ncbi:MAG: tetratricopeptide repeat protein, partial [Candidatus Cloacimonetes bacterium]|nr:tetratricopeptide repeat protein [Candidatus Cloacimonadota bacterium]